MIDPHFQKPFALGLNIEEPWYIASIEMEPVKRDCSLMEMHTFAKSVEIIPKKQIVETGPRP
ncbi:MAG: hypothetical protein WCR13_09895 [Sphaerochaeta sp.]